MKLSALRIAEPCHEDWNVMPGDALERGCAACQTRVLNLSELSRAEAEEALARRPPDGRLCVRFARDEGGEVATRTLQEERFLAALLALQSVAARRRAEEAP